MKKTIDITKQIESLTEKYNTTAYTEWEHINDIKANISWLMNTSWQKRSFMRPCSFDCCVDSMIDLIEENF